MFALQQSAEIAGPRAIAVEAAAAAGSEPRRDFVARLHSNVAALEATWRSLEEEGVSLAFSRWDWASGVARDLCAGPKRQAFAVELTESGRTVLLAPLLLRRRYGLRVIEWLDAGVCDYAGPLSAERSWSRADAVAAWNAIASVLPPADLIRIDRIPAEIMGSANPLALLPGLEPMDMRGSGIAIAGDGTELLQRLCRKSTLRELRKTANRLQKHGGLKVVEPDSPAEIDRLFDVMLQHRRERFGKLGRFDLLARPEVEAFYRAAAHRGLTSRAAQMLAIQVGDEVVAATYGLVHGDTYHGLILTMSSAPWLTCSPGLQAVAEVILWAKRNGLSYVDFSVGDMPYKSGFGVVERELFRLTRPLTMRGSLAAAAIRASLSAKAWLQQREKLFEASRRIVRTGRRLATALSERVAAAGPGRVGGRGTLDVREGRSHGRTAPAA